MLDVLEQTLYAWNDTKGLVHHSDHAWALGTFPCAIRKGCSRQGWNHPLAVQEIPKKCLSLNLLGLYKTEAISKCNYSYDLKDIEFITLEWAD